VDHDALFKMLLKRPTIFRGLFDAFLPKAGRFVDFDHLVFVDKERITIDGRKRTGDLLVKTRFREHPAGFLIHLEHQAQKDSNLARRMLEYLLLDWQEYNMPVYPIAVLSYKHMKPLSLVPLELYFPNKKVLHFDFDVIDLTLMKAESFVKLKNPAALALAARMKADPRDRVSLTRDFFLSLARTKIGREEKDLVAGFFSKYQPLSGQESLQLEEEVSKVKSKDAREAVMNLTNPFIELGKQRGRQEGIIEGRQEGQMELVLRLLTRRLGAQSAAHEKAIRKLSVEKIEALGEALLDFSASADLARWLRQNK
jgi:predicted transposase/invertase (TIGR01784 family)